MEKLLLILNKSWSIDTCVPSCKNEWTQDNSSFGQCAITSLIVNDIFGGKIKRCMCNGGSHYYNYLDGKIVDLTVQQFKGENPDYVNGEERTREYLLSNPDTKKRYKMLLKSAYKNLCEYSFEKINNDSRIDRKKLDEIGLFSTFEIDEYYNEEDCEKVTFDLAAQSTGNVFSYIHLKESDEYVLYGIPSAYTMKKSFVKIPRDILEQIFNVARDNQVDIETIKILQKNCQSDNNY